MVMTRHERTVRHLRPLPAPADGTGNRETARPAVGPGESFLGGMELLTTGVRAALVDGAGRVVRGAQNPFESPRTATAAELAAVVVDTALQCFAGADIRGVGIASVGLVDDGSGVIRDIHDLPGFRGCPVAALLQDTLRVPAFADHHARLQVLGDRWFGLGLGRSSFASVSTGDTLGVGILYEGHVIAPQGGRSGAHITVRAGGDLCTCGNRGCWKTLATTSWLRSMARERGLGELGGIAELVAAATADQRARDLVESYAANLAMGLSTIQHLVAPGLYILHGDAAAGGPQFLGYIERTLRAVSSWAEQAEQPRVVVATTEADHVALLGGAGLVLSRLGG
jgi:glucokinase